MKDFVTPIQSSALKELGFNETCIAINNGDKLFYGEFKSTHEYYKENAVILYSQAFRFFRKKHGLDSWVEEISHGNSPGKRYVFQAPTSTSHLETIKFYDSHEESESACLDKLIEVVKSRTV